jgi:hypothetical protein
MRGRTGLGGHHARRVPRLRCHNLPSSRALRAEASVGFPPAVNPLRSHRGQSWRSKRGSADRRTTSTSSRDIAGQVSILQAPGSTAPRKLALTSLRLPGPGSCARARPETPRLRPMDAERFGRPGEYPRTDRKLQKTHCGRPSPGCERRSCDRSCVQSLAWALSDIGFPVGVGARPREAEAPRNLQRSQRVDP